MPDEFRFLLICLGATQRMEDRLVNLSGIVNELDAVPGESLELTAVVGAILRPEMAERRLDLMVWRLGPNGEPMRFGDYVGTPLILPYGLGPKVLPYSVRFSIDESGVYGFYLFDAEGTFGTPERLLATYMFSITVVRQG